MENKFKLKKPLPKSWGVKNDGSQEFKEWVIGYLNFLMNTGYYTGIQKDMYYGTDELGNKGWASKSNFSTILTIEEFKSYFETETDNEWKEASKDYVGRLHPVLMEVSDDKTSIVKFFVLFELDGLFYGRMKLEYLKDGQLVNYKYAREIQSPKVVEFTNDELVEKLGLDAGTVVKVIETEINK